MNEKSDRFKCKFLWFVLFFFLFFFLFLFTKKFLYSIIFSIAAMINVGNYFVLQKVLLSVIQKKHRKGFFFFSYFLRLIVIAIAFLFLVGGDLFAALAFLLGMSIIPLTVVVSSLLQRSC